MRVHRIPVDFPLVVVLPQIEVPTREARRILREGSDGRRGKKCGTRRGALVKALTSGDVQTVGGLLEDRIALPYRLRLMPWFARVWKAALDAGAYGGAFVSGSGGPAIFALGEDLHAIGKAIAEAFLEIGVDAEVYITRAGGVGAFWL